MGKFLLTSVRPRFLYPAAAGLVVASRHSQPQLAAIGRLYFASTNCKKSTTFCENVRVTKCHVRRAEKIRPLAFIASIMLI